MSEVELVPHHDPALQQHKKKKRHREDVDEGRVDEGKAERKKRKKHREDAGDTAPPPSAVEPTPEVVQDDYAVKERKKKKKDNREKERAGEGVNVVAEMRDETATESAPEKKKKNRKRESGEGDSSAERPVELVKDVDATRERKKKKKKHDDPTVPAIDNEATGSSAVPPHDATDPPVKKKKKSKERQSADLPSSAVPNPPPDSLFPMANPAGFPTYFSDAQPTLFPFPDLALGSNEDVLRALQDIDISKIAGVLKTLTDAADAANIPLPMTALPSTSAQPSAAASTSGAKKTTKKHRRTLDMTLPSASDSSSLTGHAHLLATKWMSPAKLAELVASEGLVYKKGKFSAIEIKQINDAIENYRTKRSLSEEDVNAIIFPSDEKQRDAVFWSELTSAVSERPIIAVYHYVRRARHPMKGQGKWQPEEDAKLIQAVTSLGQQWENVARLVGRMATDCRDRYRNHIVNRDKRVSGPWSSAEEEKLTRIVVDMQKGKDLDNDIFWGKVSEMMGGTRTRQQCRIKWTDSLSKKYKADGQSARWSSRDSFILIHKIDSLNVRDDTEIDWKTIQDPQWNLWSAHVLQRRWLTMKKGIKGFEDMTHPEIMDILRVKNADVPHAKVVKSAKFVVDSDDEEPRAGSSTGPGTSAGQRKGDNSDSDSE